MSPADFEVIVSYQGTELFKFEELHMHLLFPPLNDQFYHGTNIPSKIRSSDPSFKRWFQQVCALLGTTVHLVPDTNVTRRLYYTNYLRNLLIENMNHMTISLSRLAILEIEGMYNRNKPREKEPGPNASQRNKETSDQNEEKKAKDRRFSFQSMGEILSARLPVVL
jgi:hypothetical protein